MSDPRFTQFGPGEYARTLTADMVEVADDLRDLYTEFGQRPYRVRIIRTKAADGLRGHGPEVVTFEFEILPTPKLMDLDGIQEILQPIGLDEVGGVTVREISGRLTDEILRGLDEDGTGPGVNENVFYEVEFPRLDGRPSTKRRFQLRGAPFYDAEAIQWRVKLERAHADRDRQGVPHP